MQGAGLVSNIANTKIQIATVAEAGSAWSLEVLGVVVLPTELLGQPDSYTTLSKHRPGAGTSVTSATNPPSGSTLGSDMQYPGQ